MRDETTTKPWPNDLTDAERELLRDGLIFAAIHHDEHREVATKDANDPRFKRQRKACLRVAAHHTEQLHQVGELLARVGMRNGWPRPTPEAPNA